MKKRFTTAPIKRPMSRRNTSLVTKNSPFKVKAVDVLDSTLNNKLSGNANELSTAQLA